ncbi:MAG TPA: AIR synthase-related protein, partial [Acidimicrobiales bacterium]|nr:AIR synthase-related protein [Acidimicrobiales bacterium]
AGSRWAVDIHGHRGGRLPDLDLALHLRLVRLVEELVWSGLVDGVHDVSDGGVGVALAEMAVASGVGFRVDGIGDHAALFAEEPSRVVFSVPDSGRSELERRAEAAGLGFVPLGRAGGDRLVVAGLVDVALAAAEAAWRGALPAALGVR